MLEEALNGPLEEMASRLGAEGAEGEGATFYFTL